MAPNKRVKRCAVPPASDIDKLDELLKVRENQVKLYNKTKQEFMKTEADIREITRGRSEYTRMSMLNTFVRSGNKDLIPILNRIDDIDAEIGKLNNEPNLPRSLRLADIY